VLKYSPKASPAQDESKEHADDFYGNDHADKRGHVFLFGIIVQIGDSQSVVRDIRHARDDQHENQDDHSGVAWVAHLRDDFGYFAQFWTAICKIQDAFSLLLLGTRSRALTGIQRHVSNVQRFVDHASAMRQMRYYQNEVRGALQKYQSTYP